MTYSLFLDDERQPWDVTWIDYITDKRPWSIVRSHNEFVDFINANGCPNFVSFDHDLADVHYEAMIKENAPSNIFNKLTKMVTSNNVFKFTASDVTNILEEPKADYGPEMTGYDSVKWLVEYCANNKLKFPAYAVHSKNNIGAERMKFYIENAKKHLDI